jgi:hypothetical protein
MLICIGSNIYGDPCKSFATGEDDYCDACRLIDAGAHIQSIHAGFRGVLDTLEAMRIAGDAAGISAVLTDMQRVMQRVRSMHHNSSLNNELRVA